MYRIYYVNHQYYAEPTFDSLERAFAYGRSKGFEFTVVCEKEIVGSWSPIGGTRLTG